MLLSITLTAHGASGDPGKAAIEFLEKIRAGNLNLEPNADTALAPQTAERKRQQIAKRIVRMAQDLGNDPLELGAVKQDDDLAAVIVRKVGNYDAGRLQVFPVALVKRGKNWEPAPVPASFENVGAIYAIALRKRVEELENWMLKEQVRDLAKLRSESEGRLRATIEESFSAKELASYDVSKIADRFLTACATGDLPTLLGTVGGLETPLPADWAVRLKSVESAIKAGSAVSNPWRLLISPDVARVIMRQTDHGTSGLFSIGYLDPLKKEGEKPVIESVEFEVTKTNELWRIELPDLFLRAASSSGKKNPSQAPSEPEEEVQFPEADSGAEFSKAWKAAHPSLPQASAEGAAKAWLEALNAGAFPSLLSMAKVSEKSAAVRACTDAAKIWSDVRSGRVANVAVPLNFKAEETHAVGIYQFFAARDPDKLDLRPAYFEKTATGWLWNPNPSAEEINPLNSWLDEESKRLASTWREKILSNIPILGKMDDLESPSEAEVRECVGAWLTALERADFCAAISQTVLLGGDRSAKASLQNLGYEIIALRGSHPSPSIAAIYQESPWAAAGVKIQRDGAKAMSPLYTVIKTPQGPRILIETDLIASDNRNRDFLNNAALARLGKATSPTAEFALRKILEKHQADSNIAPTKSAQ